MSLWLNPRSASACTCACALVSCRSAGRTEGEGQLTHSEQYQSQAIHCGMPEKGLRKLLVMLMQVQAGALRVLPDSANRAHPIARCANWETGTHTLGKLRHGCSLKAVEGFQGRCFVAAAHRHRSSHDAHPLLQALCRHREIDGICGCPSSEGHHSCASSQAAPAHEEPKN